MSAMLFSYCKVREAAQALLLAELGRLGPKGRKALVDSWAQFLPSYSSADTLGFPQSNQQPSSQTLTVPSAQHGGAPQQTPSPG
jgi:hypothetical protein